MNKRKLVLTVALILIYACSVFALTVTDTSVSPATTDVQAQALAKLNADMTAKFNALNTRLDSFPTTDTLYKAAQAHLNAMQQLLDAFKSAIIVLIIISGFAFMGLFYAIYIVFKSKGRF